MNTNKNWLAELHGTKHPNGRWIISSKLTDTHKLHEQYSACRLQRHFACGHSQSVWTWNVDIWKRTHKIVWNKIIYWLQYIIRMCFNNKCLFQMKTFHFKTFHSGIKTWYSCYYLFNTLSHKLLDKRVILFDRIVAFRGSFRIASSMADNCLRGRTACGSTTWQGAQVPRYEVPRFDSRAGEVFV